MFQLTSTMKQDSNYSPYRVSAKTETYSVILCFSYSYHIYSYIEYIIMHFLNKFSLDNDVILVHQKLGQKLITLEDFINLHKTLTMYIIIQLQH